MSSVVKRSLSIRGHRTSISLERQFSEELETIAERRGITFAALVAQVDAERVREASLSSALRLYVLDQVLQERDRRD